MDHSFSNTGRVVPSLKILFFYLFLVLSLRAEPTLPLPKSPSLSREPAQASWTINFSYLAPGKAVNPEPKPAAQSQVKSITVTKSNKTYREQSELASGIKEDKWIFDGIQLRKMGDSGTIVPISTPDAEHPNASFSDYSHHDFPELAWLSSETYQGVQSYQGKPVYAYKSVSGDGRPLVAYLSEAQLPMYFSDGTTVRTYFSNPPPTEKLIAPPDFLRVLSAYKKGIEALRRHPNPP